MYRSFLVTLYSSEQLARHMVHMSWLRPWTGFIIEAIKLRDPVIKRFLIHYERPLLQEGRSLWLELVNHAH